DDRTRYRYTATGWYSMSHPQLYWPRYRSTEKITPEAYIRILRKCGSRLSRSGVIATQRATMNAHPVENSHSRKIAGSSSSQYASIVTLPDIGRNPEAYEITHMTTMARSEEHTSELQSR